MLFKINNPKQLKKAFIFILMVVAIGVTTALTSGEVDTLCNETDSYLYRNDTTWQCGTVSPANTSGLVPYTGATSDVDLGANDLTLGASSLKVGEKGVNGDGLYIYGSNFSTYYPHFEFYPSNGAFSGGYSQSTPAKGLGSFSYGLNSFASGTLSLALFGDTTASNSVAIGRGATVETAGGYSLAFGLNSFINGGQYNIAMGKDSTVNNALGGASNSVAIGTNANSSSSDSIAIGRDSKVTGLSATAIGNSALSEASNSVAIGASAEANQSQAVAIGFGSKATGSDSIAIGRIVTASGSKSITIGALTNNSITNSFLVGFSANEVILFANSDDGVKVGATSGESITMSGNDLYVKDNTEIDGFLVLGSNTEGGLNAGDINASTIYYDTLTAKSPTFLCEQDTNWCQITVPQYQKSLYAQFSDDWQVLQVQFDGVTYTPSQFINTVCPTNSNTQAICDEIIEKYQKLKAKYDAHQAEQQFIQTCESQGNVVENEQCVRYTTSTTDYAGAVESYQEPIYNYTTITTYELDETLQPIAIETRKRDQVTGYTTQYKFKSGCGWTEQDSYTCTTREVIN